MSDWRQPNLGWVASLPVAWRECVHIAQGQEVFALKVIKEHLVENAAAWNRYLREARIWTTLSACDGVAEAFCITRVQ